MELVFLGTGAAEGSPAAYCRCATCQGVRERGGVEIRTRSCVRVGRHHQIDLGPDSYLQTMRAGTDLYDVEHILLTHTHNDHISLSALLDKQMSRVTNGRPMTVHLSRPARIYLEGLLSKLDMSDGDRRWMRANLVFSDLDYFQRYEIGGLAVETVKGNHTAHGPGEYSINYHVSTPEGRSLLYACDTGYYRDETWSYLEGRRVDTLLLECTFAGRTDRGEYPDGHLDLASWLRMLERMREIGFIHAGTAIYATHFNPHQGLSHFEIHERMQKSPWRATAAHDGLRVRI